MKAFNNRENGNVKKRSSNKNNDNSNNDLTDRMTDWKWKKLWLEQETGQVYRPKKSYVEPYKHYTVNKLKQQPEKKKIKNSAINTCHGPLPQEWIHGRSLIPGNKQ